MYIYVNKGKSAIVITESLFLASSKNCDSVETSKNLVTDFKRLTGFGSCFEPRPES